MLQNIMIKIKNEPVRFLCTLFLFGLIVTMAWQSDDAYHAHRMSWNFVHGNGFVYNPGERVSATTAPLFTLLNTIIYAITGSAYWSALLFNIALSMVAIIIMQKRFCFDKSSLVMSTALLAFSASFISYTTSGLENPLLFLLAGFFTIKFLDTEQFGSKELLLLSFIASLLITTRMDNAMIVLPMLVYAFLIKSENKLKAIACGFAGMLPFIGWLAFSTIYYGFPFPNTAYAKLATGFPLIEYLKLSVKYFAVAAWGDPLVLAIPCMYMIFSIIRRNPQHVAIAFGIALHYAYVIYVGGDFMFGRQFTVTFFLATFCMFDLLPAKEYNINNLKLKIVKPMMSLIIICMAFQCVKINSPLDYVSQDERIYYTYTSIVGRAWQARKNNRSLFGAELTRWDMEGASSREYINIMRNIAAENNDSVKGAILPFISGMMMYFEAGEFYYNDTIALGDPLLARLPARYEALWRHSHMKRDIPDGYQESIQSGENLIVDSSLHEYYDILCLITRSEDLFAPERLRAIINMNLGRYNYLIYEYIQNTPSD